MNNFTENDAFEFGIREENSSLLNDVNQNNYENENLFNVEVYENGANNFGLDNIEKTNDTENSNNSIKSDDVNNISQTQNKEKEQFDFSVFNSGFETEPTDNSSRISLFNTPDSKDIVDEVKQGILSDDVNSQLYGNQNLGQIEYKLQSENPVSANEKNHEEEQVVNVETLEEKDNSFDKKTEELANEINSPEKKIQMSEEDLSSLTTFEEDKVETTDIKALFDRVGINVKEASDVFKRNTEMKEKIDSRFEELKRLQLDVARKKEEQYAEINAYKEEVLSKLTEKKEEIERRLNKLKEYQTSLEREKDEFEQYRKKEKEEIERVQKEVQEAYDNRREELNHIEDVLRHQKDLLDEERSQLNLDKIQYESDKNELANNLLKFNEIVDSFTNGIEKLDKE